MLRHQSVGLRAGKTLPDHLPKLSLTTVDLLNTENRAYIRTTKEGKARGQGDPYMAQTTSGYDEAEYDGSR